MENIKALFNKEDTIFHYTKIGIAIEKILYEKRLIFSKGIKTNDPREYNPLDLSPNLEGDYNDEEFRKEWYAAEKSVRKNLNRYKYACFCLNDLNTTQQSRLYGYDLLRMWAQYGENFYGVCIAFSASFIQSRLKEQGIINHAKRIKYDRNLLYNDRALLDVNANDFMYKDKDQWAKKYIQNNLNQLFFSKHVDFQDENEFRIVLYDPEEVFKNLDISGGIKAVILGDRTEPVYHKLVKGFCKEVKAECKQLKWSMGSFQLMDV